MRKISALVFIFYFLCDETLSKHLHEIFEEKPITEDIQFYHYSKQNADTGTELKIDEIFPSNINRNLSWKFFIHGWTTSPQLSPWFYTGKDAYFQKGDYNIIFVDWSKPANQSYLESRKNAVGSGHYIGKFILHLKNNDVPLKNVHVLGHSLGSHTAGFAGKYVLKNTESRIGRLTALDPAGPIYEFDVSVYLQNLSNFTINLVPDDERVSKNDAEHVDVIHSDMGHSGIISSIGHTDFFPNGGSRMQPGCENTGDDNCSHARSTHFFVESINSKNFICRQCTSYNDYVKGECSKNRRATFGEDLDLSLRGNFYFLTNSEPPYAMGEH